MGAQYEISVLAGLDNIHRDVRAIEVFVIVDLDEA
jgi:hypothetical protein